LVVAVAVAVVVAIAVDVAVAVANTLRHKQTQYLYQENVYDWNGFNSVFHCQSLPSQSIICGQGWRLTELSL
jgi:hypothetical protein